MRGVPGAETLFIGLLTHNHGNVTRWLYLWSSFGVLAGGGLSVGSHTGSWRYIQGSTCNCENEGTTDDLTCMLYSVDATLGVTLYSMLTHDHGMERWRRMTKLSSAMMVVLCMRNREMEGRWEWHGEYEQIWEIMSTTCWIGFRRPRVGDIACLIGTQTCHIGDGKLTWTRSSLKSQFLMMIRPISSHLSLSCPQLYHHLRTRSYVIHLYLSMPWAWVNTEYKIHRVLHHPKIDCLPLPASLSTLSGPCCTQFSIFPQFRVNQWIESQLPSHMPSDLLPPDSLTPDSLPLDWLPPDGLPWDQSPPDRLPPSTPPIVIDNGLQVYLPTRSITASKCISEFTLSRPPSASPNLLTQGLQVHLWVHSIWVSKCIFKHAWSCPSSTSLRSDGMFMEMQRGVTEVDRVMGIIYSADPGVDRRHLISISSYHKMKIHTLCFPTFGLTHSIEDLMDPRNCVDNQHRVVSYLLIRILRISMGVPRCYFDYARLPSVARLTVCIYIETLK